MVPWLLQWENMFYMCYHKTHWTMTVDKVGLKLGLLETSSHGHSYHFAFDVNQSGPKTSSIANHIF